MFIKKRNILNILIILVTFTLVSACGDFSSFVPKKDSGSNENIDPDGDGDTGGDGGGDGGDDGGTGGDGGGTGGDGGDTGGDGGDTGGDGGDTGGDGTIGDNNSIFKPANKDLYFGRTYLNVDEQKAYDLALATMLDNYSLIITNDGTGGRIKIDLGKNKILNIKYNEQLKKIISFMEQDEARLFHISSNSPMANPSGFGYKYKTDTYGNITEFYIRTHRAYLNYEKYRDDMKTIELRVSAIIKSIGDTSKLTKPQIIRKLHEEYLATVAYGGMNFSSAGNITGSFLAPIPTDYFKRYLVICDGYSRSMLYLLQRLEFKAIYIIGMTPEGFHAWNKVSINGKWYNLDSTWDDSMTLNSTSSRKEHFLKSDADFSPIHPKPQIDSTGKKTGYLPFGVNMPKSANKSLTPAEYN